MAAAGTSPTELLQAFALTLRRGGLRIGTAALADAVTALGAVDLARLDDVRDTLACILVRRHADRAVFERAFDVFFSDPANLRTYRADASPAGQETRLRGVASRGGAGDDDHGQSGREADRALAASVRERLRRRDFEDMGADELAAARALLARDLALLAPLPVRRLSAHPRGRAIDLRRTMREARRTGGEAIRLVRRRRRRQPPRLVILADISGSMAAYSRMFVHLAHALTQRDASVATLLFGTRLTNVSRWLRDDDADRALASLGETVRDWDGGTRISASLQAFNRDWGRRLLSRRTTVLLLTDGLERNPDDTLTREMRRLRLTSHRLVWLNPLLRYAQFEPAARGIAMMLPFVDDFVPAHNVASLVDLVPLLGAAGAPRSAAPRRKPVRRLA